MAENELREESWDSFVDVSCMVVGKAQRFEKRAQQCWGWYTEPRRDRSHQFHSKYAWLGGALRVKSSDLWLQHQGRECLCRCVEMGEMWSQQQTEMLSFVSVFCLGEVF